MQPIKKSFFLVIDGIDGCGKTTQCKLLKEYLSNIGLDTLLTKEPGGTKTGTILRNILISTDYDIEPNTELLLYSADRLEHQKKIIIPELNSGKAIICDRFISSTYAYQIFARGLDISFLQYLEQHTVFKWPDLTIIIDLPVEIALERALKRLKDQNCENSEGKFEKSGIDFYKKVREGFLWYSENYKNVIVINGDRDIDSLFKEIKSIVNEKLCL